MKLAFFSFTAVPLKISYPGTNVSLILLTKHCGANIRRYQPTDNGNLKYYHKENPYNICIGGSSVLNNKWNPHQNEVVAMVENVCKVDNLCKLHYCKFPEKRYSSLTKRIYTIQDFHFIFFLIKIPKITNIRIRCRNTIFFLFFFLYLYFRPRT